MRKRTNKLLAVLLTGAMAMSMGACGNGGASTDNTQKKGSDDQVTIKITWWGGDARHEATQKVLDLYTESHPNVKFEAIPAGWGGYFEKIIHIRQHQEACLILYRWISFTFLHMQRIIHLQIFQNM